MIPFPYKIPCGLPMIDRENNSEVINCGDKYYGKRAYCNICKPIIQKIIQKNKKMNQKQTEEQSSIILAIIILALGNLFGGLLLGSSLAGDFNFILFLLGILILIISSVAGILRLDYYLWRKE